MTSRVLIPLDDQDCCRAAVDTILARKWDRDSAFLLCQVVEQLEPVIVGDGNVHKIALAGEQEENAYKARLWLSDTTARFAKKFSNVECRMETGQVTEVICDLAYDWAADYIVMGSHDLDWKSRCALGSVAASVLKYGPCSVESIRANKSGSCPRRVIIATDLSHEAQAAIEWVAQMKWSPKTDFRLATVTTGTHKTLKTHLFEAGAIFTKERQHLNEVEKQLKAQAKELTEKFGFKCIEADVLTDDSAVNAICELALDWQADLVVTGANGANRNPSGRAGSTAIGIMNRLHCSMIAIQSDSYRQVKFNWRETMAV